MMMWSALSLLFISCIAMAVYSYKTRALLIKIQSELMTKCDALNSDVLSVNDCAIGIGQRLIGTEKKLSTTIEELQQVQNLGDFYAFDKAQQLAEQGADNQSLSEQFGLSETEAQLMRLVKQRKAS